MKRTLAVAFILAAVSCATSAGARAERISKLSPEGMQLWSKYTQFMTERQRDEFLAAQTDLEKQQYVEGLKIDDILAQFPKPVQDAILAQSVTLGMSRAAVLLSWGTPKQREFDEDQLRAGNEIERWYYDRSNKTAYVTFTNGVVSDYDDGKK